VLELLRSIHRKLGIKYRIDRCIRYVQRFGVRGAMATHRRIWSAGNGIETIAIPGLPHPVAVRAGTADASTLEKIFVWNGYDLDYPDDVRIVIDAGANIGLSAVFFATRFPQATIVAIEPEPGNQDLLRRNTAQYPQVIPLHAALWSEDTILGLSNPQDHVDSYRYTAEASHAQVQAFSVPSVLAKFGFAAADVMKIDIEGAEAAVFDGRPEWVGRVGMFIIELHGDDARRKFTEATAALPAVRYRHGEDEVVRVQ
jgi:FkbM family methyltransferase